MGACNKMALYVLFERTVNGMITYTHKDLFSTGADALLDVVNLDGTMGQGIARTIRAKVPHLFDDFRERQKMNLLALGEPYPFFALDDHVTVLACPLYSNRSTVTIERIEECLTVVSAQAKRWKISSIAVSKLTFAKWFRFEGEVEPVLEWIFGASSDLKLYICDC